MRLRIIYYSKFDNNKKIAEMLKDRFKDSHDVCINHVRQINPRHLAEKIPDMIIFGSPVHVMMLTWSIKKWIRRFNRFLQLNNKTINKAAFYGTHMPGINIESKWLKFGKKIKCFKEIYPEVLSLDVIKMEGPLEAGAEEKVARFAEELKDFMGFK